MSENNDNKYATCQKIAWTIYTLLVVVAIVILVTMVAQDNEEKFFYSIMTAAASYVFRPTEKFMRKQISRFTDLPEEQEEI